MNCTARRACALPTHIAAIICLQGLCATAHPGIINGKSGTTSADREPAEKLKTT